MLVLYVAKRTSTQKWMAPIHDWRRIQLAIRFTGRVPV